MSAFDKLHIGAMTARNRFVRAATAESLATDEGCPTARLSSVYEKLASGGAGTIITGYAYVSPDGKPSDNALAICDDAFLQSYRTMVDAVHLRDARIVLQLVYGGSKSKLGAGDPRRLPAEIAGGGGKGALRSMPAPNTTILGPSAIEHPRTGLVPTEASASDLAALARAFGDAASRAKACGFDGVELHVAHGYLLSQFLSAQFNEREDEFGGSLENRARLALDCMRAIRDAVGPDYPVLAKLNSCDDFGDREGAGGSFGEAEGFQVARWLAQAGADCVEVSGDWHAAALQGIDGPYFVEFGARLARELDIPVIVTGGWRDLDAINRTLACDGIAAAGMSRPFICEPGLIARWESGDARPSACTGCGSCQKRAGIPCPVREGRA